MDLNITNFSQIIHPEIYPMIDELVNSLYTDSINNLIDTKCETIDDRRVFLMFLIMYFYTYLSIPKNIKEKFDMKNELKVFLSDMIRNPEKRAKCIELYTTFENSVKLLRN
jgi:hypothetical protein